MADDDRRAEIEAATDALLADSGLPRYGGHRATIERRMTIAFEAADRVRDARVEDVRHVLRQIVDAQPFGRAAMIEVADGFLAKFSPASTGDRRAEIEAVLSAIGSPECNCRSKAEAALVRDKERLDRVRDARGGDEAVRGDYELVRVDRLKVERLIDDDSDPVVIIRLRRLDDGTCVMVMKTPEEEYEPP